MSTPVRQQALNKGLSVTLNASGTGTVTIGPDQAGRGPANWHVTGVLLLSSRPGVAPIPRAVVYETSVDPNHLQGLSYDGSFAQGPCDITLTRGQTLICTWTGGQAGDVCSLTVTGEKW